MIHMFTNFIKTSVIFVLFRLLYFLQWEEIFSVQQKPTCIFTNNLFPSNLTQQREGRFDKMPWKKSILIRLEKVFKE